MLRNDELGFHLIDWQSDAAFIVALALYPERFTDEEVREGAMSLLAHVPSHVATAARISGQTITDLRSGEEI
ncbi:MAG: hypothetical protein V4773_09580 [Verrucomicrobiota bacterium]